MMIFPIKTFIKGKRIEIENLLVEVCGPAKAVTSSNIRMPL